MMSNSAENNAGSGNLKYGFSLVLILWLGICEAQYYPVIPRVDPGKKVKLFMQIQAARNDEKEIRALLQLSSIYYYRPLKQRSDLDYALSLSQKAVLLSTRLNNTVDVNNARFYVGELFIAERNMPAAEQLLSQVDDTTRLKLLLNLSNYNDFNSGSLNGYLPKATVFAGRALTLATELGRKTEEDGALLNMANIELENNAFDRCENILKRILSEKSVKPYELIRYTYITYCLLNLYEGNNNKGLYYSMKAIGTITGPADSLRAGDCYLAQAASFYCIENNDLAFIFSKKAIEAYSTNAGEASIGYALSNADVALTKAHKYVEAQRFLKDMDKLYPPQNEYDKLQDLSTWGYLYKGEKKYAQAETYYLKILKLAKADHLEDESSYRNVGDVFVQDHKYAQAKPYLIQSLNFPGNLTSLHIKSLVHYYLFVCDSVSGDYLQAIKQQNIAGALGDRIKDIVKTQEVQKLQIQYETKEKEKELKIKGQHIILLKQTNQIEQSNLAKAQLVKKETLAGSLILLALLAVSVSYYRQKQKVNVLITDKNAALQKLVQEKEWLLKEVHHRVKNNLHTVICLLESQAAYLENDALQAVESSQHRIFAMSLIHQRLYQSTDIQTVDMVNYLLEFIVYLKESFGAPANIVFQQEIESIRLDVSQAIPLALIVNEAVTNAIKYAFPDGRPGMIKIALLHQEDFVRLIIEDNGIGISANIEPDKLTSLGLELIRGLTDDLKGNVQFLVKNGTSVIVSFKKSPFSSLS